jgi:plasmid stabilization system protein ParE
MSNNQENSVDVVQKLKELEEQIKTLTDHLLFTREQVILRSESLPFLQYQIKRQIFDMMAMGKLLNEIQEELGMRWNSFQTAKREESRMAETLNFMIKYTDTALKNLEALRSEKQKLETANQLLQQQLQAKDQVISGYEKLMTEITRILEQRRAPPEIVEEIARILKTEAPRPAIKVEEETLAEEELE